LRSRARSCHRGRTAFELEVLHGEPARWPCILRSRTSPPGIAAGPGGSASCGRQARTPPPLPITNLSTFASSFDQWDSGADGQLSPWSWHPGKATWDWRPRRSGYPKSMSLRCTTPYGEATSRGVTWGRSIHHVLVYPYLSVQSPLQQTAGGCAAVWHPNKTLSEISGISAEGGLGRAIYRRAPCGTSNPGPTHRPP